MYSLVNVPTLVRDLARSPRAAAVATELLHAFALETDDLAALDAAPFDDRAQAERRARVMAADLGQPRALRVLEAARGFADELGIAAYAAALDVLERAPLGDIADLQAFVRREVLAGCWDGDRDLALARWPRALELVTDGVIGAYAGDDELARPWRRWRVSHQVGVASSAWPDVGVAVRSLPPDAAVPPAPADWAALMHEACWAVHLTGRGRGAAVTQLHALVALTAVFAPEPPPLRAVAMTVAAVHAAVVADILDDGTHAALSQPLLRLLT